MPVYKNMFAGLKQLFSSVENTKTIKFPNASGTAGLFVSEVAFNQVSGGTTYTGSVAIPAGATVFDIQFKSSVLWGGATAALNLGDSADADGYFAAIDLKATDLLVGEILSTADDGCWGGKPGVYLTAAGRRGTVTPAGNTGNLYGTADSIIGVISVGTPGTSTAGRSVMTVIWGYPIQTTATVA